MKILFDHNLPYIEFKEMETLSCRFCKLSSASDFEIFSYCKENYIDALITKDHDFDDIVYLNLIPPKIIRLTVGNISKTNLFEYLTERINVILSFINSSESLLVL